MKKDTNVLQLQARYEYDSNPIGQGQYAVVYKGKSSPGMEDVAVKVNLLGKLKPKELQYLNSVCCLLVLCVANAKEIQILVFLSSNPHPNIIYLKEYRVCLSHTVSPFLTL
jgi:hypothetical protein